MLLVMADVKYEYNTVALVVWSLDKVKKQQQQQQQQSN